MLVIARKPRSGSRHAADRLVSYGGRGEAGTHGGVFPRKVVRGAGALLMKCPDFAYVRPGTLDEALDILGSQGGGAVPLAGGQSLLAALNLRLSKPEVLVDIGGLRELRGLSSDGQAVRIGALQRHAEILDSRLIAAKTPLIAEAVRHVGHVAIRNRGTFGGSLAFADPAAELPACCVALGASITVAGRRGRRVVPAAAFFKGLFETDLQPGELIVDVVVPVQPAGRRWGFGELSRRHGDFAMAGVVATAAVSGDVISDPRIVYLGCADHARRAGRVEAALSGRRLPLEDGEWLRQALAADLAPTDSPGCTGATKLHLAAVLSRRVLGALREGPRA